MSLVSDPNILTKDRLREELQKHSISLPRSDAKKSIYVDLYRRELLDKREKLEFSSDDEVELSSSIRKSKNKTPVKKPTKTSSKVTPSRVITSSQSLDVASLSDADLVEKLKEFGVNTGPILDTTRKLYQKKLEKLLADAPKEPPQVRVVAAALADTLPLDDEFSDNSQDEEEVVLAPEPPKPKPTVTKKSPARSERLEFKRAPLKPTRSTRSYEETIDQVDYTPKNLTNTSNNAGMVTRRYTGGHANNSVTEVMKNVTKTVTANNVVTQVAPQVAPPPAKDDQKQPKLATKKRKIPVWVQVALFVLLAVAIFLIIQNMEPATLNPFKSKLLTVN